MTAELPETIPPGKYVLHDGSGRWLRSFDLVVHDDGRGHLLFTSDFSAYVVRYLLSMPGRPHDDRLDGEPSPP